MEPPSAAETGSREDLAVLAVAAAVLFWGCSSIAIKLASTTGLITSFYRLWFAIPLLWAIGLGTPGIRRGFNGAWTRASLGGGALFGVHQLLFFNSLKMTSVANVTIIGALQPALVLLVGGRLFGETTTLRAIVWSLLALAGTVVVIVGSAGTPAWNPLGDTVAVANLFAFTAYFLFSKRIRRDVGASQYVVGMTTVAGLVVLVAALLTGQDFTAPTAHDWPLLVFIAVFPGTLGHFLTNWAHRHTSAFLMSIMLLAVPVLASSGAAVFLEEPLGPPQIVGGAIVLLSIGMVVRSTRADAREALAESAAETDAP